MLTNKVEIEVKFTDVDPLGIAWHGHYVRYMEDGRESFGKEYGCRYLDIFKQGYVVPIVDVNVSYKRPLKYGDSVRIETTFIDTPAAKLIFQYQLYNVKTNELCAKGRTVQVFVEKESNIMSLIVPDFFEKWKQTNLSK
jgi:acyl-CoA thioester hydrolase